MKIRKLTKNVLILLCVSLFSLSSLPEEAKGDELNFSTLNIEGITRNDQCFFNITYNALVPKGKRGSSIPLISKGIVRGYQLKKGKGSLLMSKDTYYFVPKKGNEFTLVLDYVRDLEREGSWEYFTLPSLPVAAKCSLSFKLPYSEVNLKGKNHLMLKRTVKDGYVLISAFPRPGEKIELWWEKELKEKVKEKVQILVQSGNLFELYPNYWKLISRYALTIPSGKTKELSIRLRENLLPVDVKGKGIVDWWISEGRLKILFSEGKSGKFTVIVTYEGFVEKLPCVLTLSVPPVESEIRHSGTMEVMIFKELESEVDETSQLIRLPHKLTREARKGSELLSVCSYRFGTSQACLKISLKLLSAVVSYQQNFLVHLDGEIEKVAADIKGEVKKTKTYALYLRFPSGYRISNVEDSRALEDTVWDLLGEGRCAVSYPDGLIGKFHIRVLLESEHRKMPQECVFTPIVVEKANFEEGVLGIQDRDKFEIKKMLIEGGHEIDPEKGKAVLGTKVDRLIRLATPLWKISFTRFQVPVEMDVESSHLLEVAEGFIKGKGFFNYHLRKGRCQNFRLSLPPQAEKVSFQGTFIRSVTSKKSQEEQLWDVQLARPVRGYYSLGLDYEIKYTLKDHDMLDLWQVRPLNIHREKGFLGVFTSTGFEIRGGKVKGMWAAEAEEIPAMITRLLPSPLLLAYRFTEKPYRLSFEVIRHPHTPLLESMISKGKLDTVITPEGKEITHLLLHIFNKNKQFLKVGLPAGSSIWHASVDGRVVKPAKNPEGEYLLPLEKERTQGEGFEVEMVYVREKGIIRWRNLRLVGPAFSLPSSTIDWDLYLPEDRWFHRFKGNLNQVTGKGEKTRFSFLNYKDLGKKWEGKKKVIGSKYYKLGKGYMQNKDYSQATREYQRAMRYDAKQKESQKELQEAIVAQNIVITEGELRRGGVFKQERITSDQAKVITGGQIAQLQAITSTGVVLPREGIKYSFSKEFMTAPGIPLTLSCSFISRKAAFITTLAVLLIILALVGIKRGHAKFSFWQGLVSRIRSSVSIFLVILSLTACCWSHGKEKKITPPAVHVSIQKARYEGSIKDKNILFTASYEIKGKGKGEVNLPFYGEGIVPLSTDLPSKKGVFLPNGKGGTRLVLFDPKKISFKVTFLSSLDSADGWQKLGLKLPQSVITSMNIRLPGKGYKVKRLSTFALEQSEEKEDTILRIAIGMEREILLSFKKEEAIPQVSCEFHLADTIEISLGGIRRDVELTCIPISGQAATLDILLNEGEKVTSISSATPHVWKQDKNLLRIRLIEPCDKRFTMHLASNIRKIQMKTVTFVRSLKIEKVQRFGGILRLRVDKGLSAKVLDIEGLKKFGEILDGVSDAYMFAEGYRIKLEVYPQESKITSKTHQRFQIQEKKISLVLKSQIEVEGLPVYNLKIGVPTDYKILEVISKGLTDWACEDNHLILEYSGGLLGNNTINLVGEKKLEGLEPTELKIEGIRLPPQVKDSGVVEIETELPLQLRPKESFLLIETVSPEKRTVKAGMVNISYGYRKPEWSLVLERELLTPSITAKVDTRIRLKRDSLEGETSLDFDISDAGIKGINFSLTGEVEGVEIEGKSIRSTQELAVEGEVPVWKVTLEKHILGDYQLRVKYKEYISPEMETLSLPVLTIQKVDTIQGRVEIRPASSLEITPEAPKNLEESEHLTYTYYRQPYALNMKLKFLDQTGVLQTVVEKESISSVVSSNGEVMTRVMISLKNTLNQYLKVGLPEKSVLWQVKVDSKSVRPGFYEDGYLIPLGGRSARFRSIPVELMYVENSQMSSRRFPGYLKLTSPSFEIPAKSMDWAVYLPHKIKSVRFKSNLEKVTSREIEKSRKEFQLARYDAYRGRLSTATEVAELGEEGGIKGDVRRQIARKSPADSIRHSDKIIVQPTEDKKQLRMKEKGRRKRGEVKEREVDEEISASSPKLEKKAIQVAAGLQAAKLPKLKGLSEVLDESYEENVSGTVRGVRAGIEMAHAQAKPAAPVIPPLSIDIPEIGKPYYFYRAILTPAQAPLYIEISLRKETKYLKIIISLLAIAGLCVLGYNKYKRKKEK